MDCVHGLLLLYSLFCWSIWEPLATRAGKMGASCLLRIFRICPARKSFFPLLIKLGWINMSYIGLILLIVFSVVDPGEGPGGGGRFAPFFRPNWGAKGWKNFFWYQAPPFVRVWMTAPPPLSEGLDLPLVFTENAKKDSANIQPSWPYPWSIMYISGY